MDPRLQMALQLLAALPDLVQAGVDIRGLVEHHNTRLTKMADEGRNPTAGEWDDLNRQITSLRAILHGQ